MAYTHICPAYNNTPNRQLPMGTSPHSPWLDRLRGSTHARVLLSLFFLFASAWLLMCFVPLSQGSGSKANTFTDAGLYMAR